MNDRQKEFKRLYILNNYHIDEDLRKIFNDIVSKDFNDNSDKMDNFIRNIVDENIAKEPTEIEKLQLENEQLRQSIQMNEATILELADMMLSR